MQIGECTVILPEETDSGRFYIVLGAGQLLHLKLYLSWHLRNCLFFSKLCSSSHDFDEFLFAVTSSFAYLIDAFGLTARPDWTSSSDLKPYSSFL